jgi:hypothetical protein
MDESVSKEKVKEICHVFKGNLIKSTYQMTRKLQVWWRTEFCTNGPPVCIQSTNHPGAKSYEQPDWQKYNSDMLHWINIYPGFLNSIIVSDKAKFNLSGNRLNLTSQETSISAINSYGSWIVVMIPSEMGLYNPEVKICCAWKNYIIGHSFS